ncbi:MULTISPECIES: metallophosphoesterase [unclassified Pseudomonas]|uniref:metallophosphoesterase family protein n=1 Tax=unclassified Pseudomonas TaxID=196821 RepID=UPI000871A266|nr:MULTISPECIES: metallophosphoesterase family protein [unclassified Pseudomonas]SCW96180.1 Calcineurin-like phosphoesterase superfamily domain-containing protein [Pseudomonas sp. NFACC56-3]SFL06423.1 Calcineurin-like phosphoesterase superfamily domain-containing protein [Pseudomonas sp. NFACC52]
MKWLSENAIPLLSDVHGNVDGLLQALERIKCNGIQCPPLFLGDLFWTGMEERDPRAVLELVMSLPATGFIKGNTEDYLFSGWLDAWEPADEENLREKATMLAFRSSLSNSEIAFIQGMPRTLLFEYGRSSCFVTHASPSDIEKGLTLTCTAEEWGQRMAQVSADVVITGHLHRPFSHRVNDVLHVCVGAIGRHGADYDGIIDYALLNETPSGISVVHDRFLQR